MNGASTSDSPAMTGPTPKKESRKTRCTLVLHLQFSSRVCGAVVSSVGCLPGLWPPWFEECQGDGLLRKSMVNFAVSLCRMDACFSSVSCHNLVLYVLIGFLQILNSRSRSSRLVNHC
jgi:hypothetical protein